MTAKPLLIVVGDADAPSCEDGVCAVQQSGSQAAVDAKPDDPQVQSPLVNRRNE